MHLNEPDLLVFSLQAFGETKYRPYKSNNKLVG